MKEGENENEQKIPAYLRDVAELTRSQLRLKYKLTYDSWKNAKYRAKAAGNWNIEFDDFTNFLRLMGPRKSREETLDRIDNSNPAYGPGLCRWADKRVQANNRSSTVHLEHNGEFRPVAEIAFETGQKAGSIHQRRYRGWRDDQAISGNKSLAPSVLGADPRKFQPWASIADLGNLKDWELEFHVAGGIKRWGNRFRYLIARLDEKIRELSDWLWENREEEPDANIPEEALKQFDARQRYVAFLAQVKSDEVAWLEAVRIFESEQYEKKVIRGYVAHDWYTGALRKGYSDDR